MPSDKRLSLGEHAFTTSTGATLTYFVCGQGPRVLVNIAPGWGCASTMYQNSFQFLEHAFTFVHLETRGTRGSSFPSDLAHMSSWHMVEDVEALRVYLGLDALDGLMGHSNGGCIALWYAIVHPKRVSKLVLLDTEVLGPQADAVAGPATRAILDARPDRDVVEAAQKWNDDAFTSDEEFGIALNFILPLYFAKPERDVERFRREIFTGGPPQHKCIQTQHRADRRYNGQAVRLTEVKARTLIVVGREDFVCPVPVSELIKQRVRNSTLAVFDDSGHLPWVEQTEEFTHVFNAFFRLS
ncbi:alpha/beta-hydrolase [Exidia glandulosa HHB12029]|uniref:Alpha/beta-hydrolase n=1 Tax=Exidia glandulosa HHB12029 TaxID=1314781 RepID=A0A165GYD2_EXIGL|nr:alpha/beta-hydrolase [Exidia glandulosa HHB12029]